MSDNAGTNRSVRTYVMTEFPNRQELNLINCLVGVSVSKAITDLCPHLRGRSVANAIAKQSSLKEHIACLKCQDVPARARALIDREDHDEFPSRNMLQHHFRIAFGDLARSSRTRAFARRREERSHAACWPQQPLRWHSTRGCRAGFKIDHEPRSG